MTATLPSGRTAWFRVDPATVPVGQINRIAEQTTRADVRHALRTRRTARSIAKLSASLTKQVESMNAAQLRGDRKLGERIRKGDAKVEKRLTKAVADGAKAGTKSAKQLTRVVGRIRRRAVWDSAVIASAAPLFAAYGQRKNPLGAHNVTLAAALGVWLFGDELTDLISGKPDDPPTLVKDVDLWSYIAPFGNLLAGWWLLRDEQHERFVTGAAGTFEAAVRLPSPTFLTATLVRDAITVMHSRREETGKRLLDLAAHMTPAEVSGMQELATTSAHALRSLPEETRRLLLRLYVSWFLIGGPTAEEIDDVERAVLMATAKSLDLDEATAVALQAEGIMSDEKLVATQQQVVATIRAAIPLAGRRAFLATGSSLLLPEVRAEPSVQEYFRWLAGALGLDPIEIVHVYAVDLAAERVAVGYEGRFREIAIAATAVLSEGSLSEYFVCDVPRVSAAVVAGILEVQVVVPVFGTVPRKLLALPVPRSANVDAPTVDAPTATTPGAPSPSSLRIPPQSHSGLIALLEITGGTVPSDRDARERARQAIAELMVEFLWTQAPKVAWIVDTQSPK